MLHVQRFLRDGNSYDQLFATHGVKATVTNGKVGLNYDQIAAKDTDPLACECRGLILREGSFDIVAAPMFRFFNIEQTGVAADIDHSTAKFFEKMDGTLCIVYFDSVQQQWCVATRGRPEADVPLGNGIDWTFTDLFNIAVRHITDDEYDSVQDLMRGIETHKTFCFELCSPHNQIVCEYSEPALYLLAVRDNHSLLEEHPEEHIGRLAGVRLPASYSFSSLKEMTEFVLSRSPKKHEGLVERDRQFRRVKVKNPKYVAYNAMHDSLKESVRNCMKLVLLGGYEEFFDFLPKMIQKRINFLAEVYSEVVRRTEADYEELKGIDDMKEFALKAKGRVWDSFLFMRKRNKINSIRDFVMSKCDESGDIMSSTVDHVLSVCAKLNPEVERMVREAQR